MTTISALVSDELYKNLCSVARELKRSKSFLIKEAVSQYIEEILEDIQDIKEAEEILSQYKISWEVVQRNYGLLGD